MIRRTGNRSRGDGFTVIEVMLTGALMSLLAVLISSAWAGLGRSTADATARCRIAQAANLAAESLAHDFCGSLPGQITGKPRHGRVVGRLVAGSQVQLCFDGDADGQADWAPPDTVITYEVQSSRLVRKNLNPAAEWVIRGEESYLSVIKEN